MIGLIVASITLLACSWLLQGFNFASVMSLVATALFCGRQVGYFCKPRNIVTMEVIGMFITVVTQLLLRRFMIIKCLLVILVRVFFVGLVYYDTKCFVYVTEERRREEEE